MNAMPTREEIAGQLRSLIEGRKTREDVSAWATKFVIGDYCVSDKVAWDAITTLGGADVRADLDHYLYEEIDFRAWLDDLLR